MPPVAPQAHAGPYVGEPYVGEAEVGGTAVAGGASALERSASRLAGDGMLERLRRRVADDPAVAVGAAGPPRAVVRSAVARAVREEGVLLPPAALAAVVQDLVDALTGLGPVQALLRDAAVTDVMVNGPREVWVERAGRLQRTDVEYGDVEEVRLAVLRVVAPLGLRFDPARPYVDAGLPDGTRLHAVLPPLAPGGPVVTLRKFAAVRPGWDELAASGAVPVEAGETLRTAVADRRAVVCCGRTGTGKTTLLDLLIEEVGDDERVVVIEDAPELRCRCSHAVRLQTRTPNAEGAGEVTVRDLVRQALRMRPDRIVVGEVRGVEIVDVLQALATGHEGCMTTVHARSAEEALLRVEGMALLAGLPLAAARAQVRAGIDVLAVLARGPEGRRGLVEVAEIRAGDSGRAPGARPLWKRERW